MYPFYALHDYYIYLLKKIFVSTDRLGPFAVTMTTTARGAGAQEQAPTAQAGRQPSPGTCPSSRPDGNRIDRLRPVPRPGSSSRSSIPPNPTTTSHATRPPTHNPCLHHQLEHGALSFPSASPIPTRRLVLPQFPKPRLIPKGSWCSPPPRRLSQPPPPLPPAPPACAAAVALVVVVVDELAS